MAWGVEKVRQSNPKASRYTTPIADNFEAWEGAKNDFLFFLNLWSNITNPFFLWSPGWREESDPETDKQYLLSPDPNVLLYLLRIGGDFL